MIIKKESKLASIANTLRGTLAGRRRSDEVILRALRSDSSDVTVARRDDIPDEIKAPACPKCGAKMIHASGQRSENDEFWACSMLKCDGSRQVSG
jgi:hypothetical protein